MKRSILDASAILALLNNEEGADMVAEELQYASVCTVNLAEVIGRLMENGLTESVVRQVIISLRLQIIDFTAEMAFEAGRLKSVTKKIGLSLGDRSCLAAAKVTGGCVLTADRIWVKVDTGVKIKLIRNKH